MSLTFLHPNRMITSCKSCIILALITLFLSMDNIVGLSATTSSTSNNDTNTQKVAVIGTTGRLGRNAIVQLSSRSIPTRCLLRHPIPPNTTPDLNGSSSSEIAAYLSTLPNVEMVVGDVTQRETIDELLQGCHAVLSLQGASQPNPPIKSLFPFLNPENGDDPTHPKMVNYVGIQNIFDASKYNGKITRIIQITAKGESPCNFFSILFYLFGRIVKGWNYKGEELLHLQNNSMDYTIICPPNYNSGDMNSISFPYFWDYSPNITVSGLPSAKVLLLSCCFAKFS
mmetsp:Transcript_10943/g.15401  ORF Transcript_10943/g.15401 Transcript_10943/m.15401 type:complete len:284 (-) Transcript_10943:68-919(-)